MPIPFKTRKKRGIRRNLLPRFSFSNVVQVRAEGPKAPSPGQRPGYSSSQQGAL